MSDVTPDDARAADSVRASVEGLAATQPPVPDWPASVQTTIARRRAQRAAAVTGALAVAVLLTGTAVVLSDEPDELVAGPSPEGASSSHEVPAETSARFKAEAERHATVKAERGCSVTTSGDMLAEQQSRQDATGAPIDGWLLESPRDTRVYRCTYDAKFFDGGPDSGRLAVWEAAEAAAGGPRPAVDMNEG